MVFYKILNDLIELNNNFTPSFKFSNEENELFLTFKNKNIIKITDQKIFILGSNNPILLNQGSSFSFQERFGVKDLSNFKFIPFEVNIDTSELYLFLLINCEIRGCKSVVTNCNEIDHCLKCINHCSEDLTCKDMLSKCTKDDLFIEFNSLLDNYIKLSIEKLFNKDDSKNPLDQFPNGIPANKFNQIIKKSSINLKNNPQHVIWQKISLSSTIGCIKIVYNEHDSFLYAFENHPLKKCTSNYNGIKKMKSFLQIINNTFNSKKEDQFRHDTLDSIHRLYYGNQFFPQNLVVKQNYKEFFDLINFSEDLFNKNPDLVYGSLAKHIIELLKENEIINKDKYVFSMIDLGCGEGNLTDKVLEKLIEKYPDIKVNLQLVEIDKRKLTKAFKTLRSKYSRNISSIKRNNLSIFELTEMINADISIISQVFDLYINFVPNSNLPTKIKNQILYQFYHYITFLNQNLGSEHPLINFERCFITNYQGNFERILRHLITFSENILIFDHFFKKRELDDFFEDRNVIIKNVKVDKFVSNKGLKFTHIYHQNSN